MTGTTVSVSLYERTLELANSAPRHVKQKHMAEAIGKSDVWISEFLSGRKPNPYLHDVQALHDFLLGIQNTTAN